VDKDEALKLALEALQWHWGGEPLPTLELKAINAIKEALAQSDDLTIAYMAGFYDGKNTPQRKPDQKPVACPFPCGWKRLFEIIVADGAFLARSLEEGEAITEHQREVVMHVIGYAKDMALHGMEATPPQRTWVGLTEEDRNDCLVSADPCECLAKPESHQLMEDVETKLREKNT